MQEVSKAEFEAIVLEKFLQLTGWIASEVEKTESPDFLIVKGGQVVGLEICKIQHEKEQDTKFFPVERASAETRIALSARQYFARRYQIPLHVDIAFKRRLQVDARTQELLPQKIAEHVWQEIQHKEHHTYYSISKDRNLPEELSHLFIYFHPEAKKPIWYSGKAFMLPDLSWESILKIVAEKERKVPLYKRRAHNLMLLLVEGFSMESLFDSVEIPHAPLQTLFDDVYLLRDMEDRVLQLN